ncbi:hypothetical protein MH117_19050 [Paenibacillus sp. ACRRX]|uniref:hypothetical protein n=1 Tax=Paenibacillus sp. ACRRX TaxID=2918206 RepID=UPI001EF4F432|nr:hypothetical protein [Paenibacillus sp. ACRRX]MCG7409510.1 hypothetical protein [Paenibacillus sp. ACRRX]
MVKRISLKCSTFLERHDAIDAAKNVISNAGAWIINFKTFSKHMGLMLKSKYQRYGAKGFLQMI